MRTRVVVATAVLTAVATLAFAQNQAPPKATQAEVEKLIASIKADKAKLGQFCELTKLEVQATSLAQKNPEDPKLQDLGKQMEDIATKLGPDYERITSAELDDASSALLDDLSKSCNVGFVPAEAPPKATKADVQKLVDSIKNDKAKYSQFCDMTKLIGQAGALAQKNPSDPKLQDLAKQINGIAANLGPDYQKITTSDLDEASTALLNDLFKSCK